MFKKIRKTYIAISILFFNTVILFGLVNWYFYYKLQNFPDQQEENLREALKNQRASLKTFFKTQPEKVKELYPGIHPAEIRKLFKTPGFIAHPSLGYSLPRHKSAHQNIGEEGIRLSPDITRSMVPDSLNQAVWVFGGSTTYGKVLPDNGTIVHYLNQLDTLRYFNMGCPGYRQVNEIRKLLLLLHKGYRPQKVIFIDGNNDLLSMRGTHFEAAEMPDRHRLAYQFYDAISIKNRTTLIEALPITKYFRKRKINFSQEKIELPFTDVYNPNSLYHTNPEVHAHQSRQVLCSQLPNFPERVADYYLQNQSFLKELGKAFQFDVQIIFQPIGWLKDNHALIADFDQFKRDFECFELLKQSQTKVRQLIKEDQLDLFVDLSQTDKNFNFAYIDGVHYSVPFCKYLAQQILELSVIPNF